MAIFGIFLFQFCFAGQASAAPQYDSQAWKKFIENNETAKLPSGIPTGPATVSRWNGKEFWPDKIIFIASPIDMSKKPGMNFSDQAKEYKAVYASQTMADFLEATLTKFRELTKDSSITLPINYLFHNENNIVPALNNYRTVNEMAFGIFGLENGKTVSYPTAAFTQNGFVVSESSKNQEFFEKQYQYYTKLCNEQKESISQLSGMELNKTVRDLWNQADELARKELGYISRQRILQNVNSSEKREDYLKALNEAKSDEEREAILNKHYEDAKAQDLKDAEELLNNDSATKPSAKRKYIKPMKLDDLDDATTWFLLEAILTQKAAEVIEIHLSKNFINRLVEYAQKNKRPQAVLSKLLTVTETRINDFKVILGCSIRDRFLGCQSKSSKDIEGKVNVLASQMLKLVEKAPAERKFEILQLVVNANPTNLTYSPDLEKLKEESSTPAQKALLSRFKRIPVNGVAPKADKIDIGVRTDKKNNKNNKRQTQTRPDETRIGLPF